MEKDLVKRDSNRHDVDHHVKSCQLSKVGPNKNDLHPDSKSPRWASTALATPFGHENPMASRIRRGSYRHHDRPGSFTDRLAGNRDVRIQGAPHGQPPRTRSACRVSQHRTDGRWVRGRKRFTRTFPHSLLLRRVAGWNTIPLAVM